MRHIWVSGFGKDAKEIRELTEEEKKKMDLLEWHSPKEILLEGEIK